MKTNERKYRQNTGGRNKLVPGRVVCPKRDAMPARKGLYRVISVSSKGALLRNEHGNRMERLYNADELIVAR